MIHRFLLTAAGMALASAVAFGSTLNGYGFSSTCQQTAGATNSGCSSTTANGSGTVGFGLNSSTGPYVTVNSSGGLNAPTGANSGYGIGDLTYQLEVFGPSPTVAVDASYMLTVAGSYTVPLAGSDAATILSGASFAVGPYNVASTQIDVSASSSSFSDTSSNAGCVAATGLCSGSQSGPSELTLTTGIAYNIVLRAQAGCSGQSPGNSYETCSTSASVDPMFSIDPGQVNGNQYSIVLSDGVGNGQPSAAAPEPASVVLMGLGLGVIGFGERARRARRTS